MNRLKNEVLLFAVILAVTFCTEYSLALPTQVDSNESTKTSESSIEEVPEQTPQKRTVYGDEIGETGANDPYRVYSSMTGDGGINTQNGSYSTEIPLMDMNNIGLSFNSISITYNSQFDLPYRKYINPMFKISDVFGINIHNLINYDGWEKYEFKDPTPTPKPFWPPEQGNKVGADGGVPSQPEGMSGNNNSDGNNGESEEIEIHVIRSLLNVGNSSTNFVVGTFSDGFLYEDDVDPSIGYKPYAERINPQLGSSYELAISPEDCTDVWALNEHSEILVFEESFNQPWNIDGKDSIRWENQGFFYNQQGEEVKVHKYFHLKRIFNSKGNEITFHYDSRERLEYIEGNNKVGAEKIRVTFEYVDTTIVSPDEDHLIEKSIQDHVSKIYDNTGRTVNFYYSLPYADTNPETPYDEDIYPIRLERIVYQEASPDDKREIRFKYVELTDSPAYTADTSTNMLNKYEAEIILNNLVSSYTYNNSVIDVPDMINTYGLVGDINGESTTFDRVVLQTRPNIEPISNTPYNSYTILAYQPWGSTGDTEFSVEINPNGYPKRMRYYESLANYDITEAKVREWLFPERIDEAIIDEYVDTYLNPDNHSSFNWRDGLFNTIHPHVIANGGDSQKTVYLLNRLGQVIQKESPGGKVTKWDYRHKITATGSYASSYIKPFTRHNLCYGTTFYDKSEPVSSDRIITSRRYDPYFNIEVRNASPNDHHYRNMVEGWGVGDWSEVDEAIMDYQERLDGKEYGDWISDGCFIGLLQKTFKVDESPVALFEDSGFIYYNEDLNGDGHSGNSNSQEVGNVILQRTNIVDSESTEDKDIITHHIYDEEENDFHQMTHKAQLVDDAGTKIWEHYIWKDVENGKNGGGQLYSVTYDWDETQSNPPATNPRTEYNTYDGQGNLLTISDDYGLKQEDEYDIYGRSIKTWGPIDDVYGWQSYKETYYNLDGLEELIVYRYDQQDLDEPYKSLVATDYDYVIIKKEYDLNGNQVTQSVAPAVSNGSGGYIEPSPSDYRVERCGYSKNNELAIVASSQTNASSDPQPYNIKARVYNFKKELLETSEGNAEILAYGSNNNSLYYPYNHLSGCLNEVGITDPTGNEILPGDIEVEPIIYRYYYFVDGMLERKENINDGYALVTNSYNHLDRLFEVIDTNGNTTRYLYDLNNNTIEVSTYECDSGYPDGKLLSHVVNRYDRSNRLLESITDHFEYNIDTGALEDLGDNKTLNVYDRLSRIIETHYDNGSFPEEKYGDLVKNFYDNHNRMIATISYGKENDNDYKEIKSTIYDYSDKSNQIIHSKTISYPTDGIATNYIKEEYFFYDAYGRVVASVKKKDTNEGVASYSRYDSNGVIYSTDSKILDGIATVTLGSLDLYNEHSYTDFPSSMVVNGPGAKTLYKYNGFGNLTATMQFFDQDNHDDPGINNEYLIIHNYEYDDNSRKISAQDGKGNTTLYRYDSLNRPFQTEYADQKLHQYLYNESGLMSVMIKPDGSTLIHDYTALYQLENVYGGTVNPDISDTMQYYRYDGLGRVVECLDHNSLDTLDDNVRILYDYDSFGNVTYETQQINQPTVNDIYEIDRIYNNLGELVKKTHSHNNGPSREISYEYYPGSRVNNIKDTTGSTERPLGHWEYRGSIAAQKLITTKQNQTVTVDVDINKLGQIEELTYSGPSSPNLLNWEYTYDNASNLISVKRGYLTVGETSDTSWDNYRYDLVDRVERADYFAEGPTPYISPIYQEYDIDKAGNWNPNPVSDLNEYESFNGNIQEHDDTGHRTLDDTTIHRYDILDRLVSTEIDGMQISYTYTTDNLRASKTVDNVTTIYCYDNSNIIEEREKDVGGDTVIQYVQSGLDKILETKVIEPGEVDKYRYPLTDITGSVVMLLDENAQWIEKYLYDIYGGNLSIENNQSELWYYNISNEASKDFNRFFFHGRRLDEETGLFYFRNRYYDPTQGRFISRDPLGMWADSVNMGNAYTYAGNNPLSYSDRFGLSSGPRLNTFRTSDPGNVGPQFSQFSLKGNTGSCHTSAVNEAQNRREKLAKIKHKELAKIKRKWQLDDDGCGRYLEYYSSDEDNYSQSAMEAAFSFFDIVEKVNHIDITGVTDFILAVKSFADGDFVAGMGYAIDVVGGKFTKPIKAVSKALDLLPKSVKSEVSQLVGFTDDVAARVKVPKKAPHGNSLDSTKTQHRYEITEVESGDVVKTGISGQPLNKNGTSPRANRQVNKLNREEGAGTYEATVPEVDIPGRRAALEAEQAATDNLFKQGHSLRKQIKPEPSK